MVRIIAGERKGRVLATPTGSATRPTADRVRQALFDVLAHAPWGGPALLDGAHVLDAFAGTGALGLEALSRGGRQAVFLKRTAPPLPRCAPTFTPAGGVSVARCTRVMSPTHQPPALPRRLCCFWTRHTIKACLPKHWRP
ncbi:hypothetical protein AGA_382 [Acetobacter ghanensis]|uniref:Methyltransferase n=1 Tax=Acetobacter ghanensis TaxID=431306 RepID=A0A0U5F2H7_9PROT|nr:hypothetical protein AGA_382 [Acetobacter ghanensis]